VNVRTWKTLSGARSLCALSLASCFATQVVTETIASTMIAPRKMHLEQSTLTKFVQASHEEFTVTDVTGQAGQSIPLNIKPNPSDPPEDLFAITGLPPEAKLSSGTAYDDFWLVRRKELPSLALITPEAFSRKFQIAITRVRSADRPPVTLTATISVLGRSPAAGALSSMTRGPSPYLRTPNESILFDKALERFRKGDVSGARAIFEVLAAKGDGDAAIAMGETYDPVVLAQLFVKGLQPDEGKAIMWYKKAEELGDQRAKIRLNALNQN
jgi:hypothetical protein